MLFYMIDSRFIKNHLAKIISLGIKMSYLFYLFLSLNIVALVLIGYDKFLAKNHKSRISEKTLLTFVLIGGTIGSGIAMLTFRHKTAKRSY